MKKMFLLLGVIFLFGCMQQKDFGYGVNQINKLNSEYNTTIETYPNNLSQINLMLNEFSELRSTKLNSGQEPFDYIVSYRIANLESEKLYIQGQKYGRSGTTKEGFGCKQRPLIIESVSFRNKSALKGFEAVNALNEFILKYPENAKSVGLSNKNSVFLNATFYQIHKDAVKDSNTINNFCPASRVLELYQEEFRKKTDFSGEYINNLDYETAVIVWKKLRGFE